MPRTGDGGWILVTNGIRRIDRCNGSAAPARTMLARRPIDPDIHCHTPLAGVGRYLVFMEAFSELP